MLLKILDVVLLPNAVVIAGHLIAKRIEYMTRLFLAARYNNSPTVRKSRII